MKTVLFLSTSLLLVDLISAQAAASDLMIPASDAIYDETVHDVDGWYIGGTIGAHSVDVNVDGVDGTDGIGGIGGVFLGYSTSMSGVVVGGEVDIEGSSFSSSLACPNPAWTCEAHVNAMGSLRGRLGFAVESILLYGTAGLAVGNVGGSTNDGVTNYPDSQIRVGWTAGAGVEAGFDEQWFGRLEYRYTDLGSQDMQFDVVYPDVEFKSHALRVGVGYRF